MRLTTFTLRSTNWNLIIKGIDHQDPAPLSVWQQILTMSNLSWNDESVLPGMPSVLSINMLYVICVWEKQKQSSTRGVIRKELGHTEQSFPSSLQRKVDEGGVTKCAAQCRMNQSKVQNPFCILRTCRVLQEGFLNCTQLNYRTCPDLHLSGGRRCAPVLT